MWLVCCVLMMKMIGRSRGNEFVKLIVVVYVIDDMSGR